MSMIKNLIIKYKELIIYAVFGVCTTLVNFVSYKLFNILLGDKYYLLSNVVAWLISVIFAYVTNKLFVFESKSWDIKLISKEISSFFAARIFSFVVEEAGLFLLVDVLNMKEISISISSFTIGGDIIAKVLLAVIVVVLNYFFSKLVVFKKKEQ